MKLKIRIHEEDGGFWAEVPTLPGCYSQGRTLDEIKANIVEAVQGHLETIQETLEQEPKRLRDWTGV
jgi:predicted RNase H-like HicB family nuclease